MFGVSEIFLRYGSCAIFLFIIIVLKCSRATSVLFSELYSIFRYLLKGLILYSSKEFQMILDSSEDYSLLFSYLYSRVVQIILRW